MRQDTLRGGNGIDASHAVDAALVSRDHDPMIIQAGDLAVQIDTGTNESGAVVQRLADGEWRDYLRDGKSVRWPVAVERLEPGRYRVQS